jgi:single-strand DNA-binding protein
MSGSVNKVILVGNLGADPEVRAMQSGSKMAQFNLATSETWRDKQTGEKKEKTEWHRVVVWSEGLIKVVEQYVKKGDKLYIEGQLQTRKWQDQEGKDRYSTEVVLQNFNSSLVMLSSPGGGKREGYGGGGPQGDEFGQSGPMDRPRPAAVGAGPAKSQSFARDLDDEVPF